MAATLHNYQDVQNLLNNFVSNAGVDPGGAPHGVFWETLTYEQFITEQVPNLSDIKIVQSGSAATSGIIQALSGTGPFNPNTGEYPQMPFPSPPYPGQQDVIDALSAWIDAGCPNGSVRADSDGAAEAPVTAAAPNSYKEIQTLLNNFVSSAGVDPGGAPHGVFWETLTYEQFITEQVPNLSDIKIVQSGSAATSGIIQALSGTGPFNPNTGEYPQMPFPSPPYPGQQAVIDALSAWINAGCPNDGLSAEAAYE